MQEYLQILQMQQTYKGPCLQHGGEGVPNLQLQGATLEQTKQAFIVSGEMSQIQRDVTGRKRETGKQAQCLFCVFGARSQQEGL